MCDARLKAPIERQSRTGKVTPRPFLDVILEKAPDQHAKDASTGTFLWLLLGFAAVLYLTMQSLGSGGRSLRAPESYLLTVKFDNIGGLKVYAPVKLAGVRIGRVASIDYDSISSNAVVTLGIERRYDRIPEDSDAAILTSGLLGGNYVGLTPGGSDIFLRPAAGIESARSAFRLEETVKTLVARLSGQ